jgi:hypothetical protein
MLAPDPLPLPLPPLVLLLRISMPLLVLLLGIWMPWQQLGMRQPAWALLLGTAAAAAAAAAAAGGPQELDGQHGPGATAAALALPQQPPAVALSA